MARLKPYSALRRANDALSISRISLFLRSAGGEQRAQALAQRDEGLPRAEVEQRRRPSPPASRRPRRAGDPTRGRRSMSLSMRACTERIACSSVVHCSNSAVSASTRLSIRRTLELFLPRRPRSSSVCSASWRRESPMWRATWFSIRCAPSCTTCSSTWRRCGSSCAPSAASSSGRRLSFSPIVVAVDARGERLARREREHALQRHAERARGLALLLRDLRLDLLERRQRVVERVDLVEHDEARRRVRAEVVAPDRQVGLGDAGVGAEDEDGGVRARQQAQRQLGLGADRVQPRRVEHDQALLEQRMRVVDERVAPGRHLDLAVVVARRVVVGRARRPRSRARAPAPR